MIVTDKEGVTGVIDPEQLESNASHLVVRFGDGYEVLVTADMLRTRDDGSHYLPLSLTELEHHLAATPLQPGETTVIPVIEEELHIDKHKVETGKVRVTKVVHEREEVVDLPLRLEEIEVKHVAINRKVDGPVAIRYEGDTIVIPLLKEELVVQKQLVLQEEVHITRRRTEKREPEHVTLRSEEILVERGQVQE